MTNSIMPIMVSANFVVKLFHCVDKFIWAMLTIATKGHIYN